jgi:hypothetical protein
LPNVAALTSLAVSFCWRLDSYATGPPKIMRHPFGSGYTSLFSSLPVGFGRRVRAGGLVVASEVAFDEVTVFKGVFDWVAMVVAQQLDYLVKTIVVLVRCLWTLSTIVTNSLSQCLYLSFLPFPRRLWSLASSAVYCIRARGQVLHWSCQR